MTIDAGINQLAKLADKKGYVTYDEFNETFPDRRFTSDELEGACVKLHSLDIEIRDIPAER
jgi:RNA polymerase primary sigma factor